MNILAGACAPIAIVAGLLAVFGSQASSPNYCFLFIGVLGMSVVSGGAAIIVWRFEQNFGVRWMVAVTAGLAALGSVELGCRIVGLRLVG
jgi:hypothetical protein